MATTLTEQDGDKVLEVAASGKLTHRDYEQFRADIRAFW